MVQLRHEPLDARPGNAEPKIRDAVTEEMLSLLVPLYVLYEGSILLASLLDRRAARAAAADTQA